MRVLTIAMLALLIGCSHKSEDATLIDAMSPAKSWSMSLAFMAELYANNQVPASLLRNSIESARKDAKKANDTIRSSAAREELKRRLRADLNTFDSAMRSLDQTIEARDRHAALPTVALFRRAGSDLDAAKKEYEP